MARAFVASSSQRLVGTIAARAFHPITLACWYYPTQSTTSQVLMGLCDYSYQYSQTLRWGAGASAVSAASQDNTGTFTADVAVTPADLTNKWNFACGTFASRSNRSIYTGLEADTDTGYSYLTTTDGDRLVISSYVVSAVHYSHFDGYVAHAAMWGAVLTADEVASLYNNGIGCDPRSIRPDALIAYWPLLNNDGDRDWWGQFNLTASGSPTYAQHPPVLMRSRPKYVVFGSVAPTVGEVTITGTRTIGETITANATPTPGDATLTYQWEKSSTGSGSGTDISGETASTLALTYADFGDILDTAAYVRCGVVATKDAVPSVETFSSWLEVSAGGAASVGSPFVSSSIR